MLRIEAMKREFETSQLQRRNLQLYSSTEKIMSELRVKLEAVSDTEVLRYALRYLEQLLIDQKEGRSLYIRRKQGDEYIVSYQTLNRHLGEEETTTNRNVRLNQATIDRINSMKAFVGVTSDSAIVRRALRYLSLVMMESDDGSEFILTDGRSETYVRMDILTSNAASNHPAPRPTPRQHSGVSARYNAPAIL